jgi:hypothetical protein
MTFELPAGGDGQRSWQCLYCNGLDPLKSEQVNGWLNGELAPKDQVADRGGASIVPDAFAAALAFKQANGFAFNAV